MPPPGPTKHVQPPVQVLALGASVEGCTSRIRPVSKRLAAVSGTIACTAGETWAILQARVIQGQRSGFGSLLSQTCAGEPQQWSLVVVSSTGLWHPGRASAGITVITLGEDGVDEVQLDRFIHLMR
jgi:hypothetical protein